MRRLPRPLPLPRPILFHVAGLLAVAGLCATIYGDSQRAAQRMLALRKGPPPAVALDAFDPARDLGAGDEVALRARVMTTMPMQIVYRAGPGRVRALAYPVTAPDAPAGPVLGFVAGALATSGTSDLARLVPDPGSDGAPNPVVVLNGTLGAPAAVGARVEGLLRQAGLALSDDLLAITPFPEGREAALAAPQPTRWRTLWMVAALALLGAGEMMRRLHPILTERRRLDDIARSGPRRSGVAPAMATHKARSRLAPLAPQPVPAPRPAPAGIAGLGRIARPMRRLWLRVRTGAVVPRLRTRR